MPLGRVDLTKYMGDVFIETGTHHGKGVRQALRAGFPKVYTVERDVLCAGKMKPCVRDERVELVYGSSPCVLPYFLSECDGKDVTIWLDAHPEGELSLENSPVDEELQVIWQFVPRLGRVNVLIDDMRLYSEADQLILAFMLEAMRPEVEVGFEQGVVADDILVGRM